MPVWAFIYLAIFGVLALLSAIDERRQRRPWLLIAADLLASGIFATLFAAWFWPPLDEMIGRSSLPLFVLASAWMAFAVHREMAAMKPNPELSARANFIAEHAGIALGVLVLSPAIAFAALTVARHW